MGYLMILILILAAAGLGFVSGIFCLCLIESSSEKDLPLDKSEGSYQPEVDHTSPPPNKK